MSIKQNWKKITFIIAIFLGCFYLPVGVPRFNNALLESLELVKWYAREHVILCLVPAFFIAGAISVFISQASVMKYLGAGANKVLAYGVASISGSILAVCSCTVLPLFAGIYKMGAGLGPAATFLYAGPAVNILAIILTARILGFELGIARAIGAIVFSIVIGLLMHLIYRKEEIEKIAAQASMPQEKPGRPLWKNALYFASMVGILVFANWAKTGDVRAIFLCCPNGLTTYKVEGTKVSETDQIITMRDTSGTIREIPTEQLLDIGDIEKNPVYENIFKYKWAFVIILLGAFSLMVISWFTRDEISEWVGSTWSFALQILPLLLGGVLVAGFLLGRVGHEGIIPTAWVNKALGGNSIRANLFASVAGAFMYFATLTEVPILQGLIGAGMGKGPALALLLAGPALSLPSMLVIRSVMGTRKTIVFVSLVVTMATISGVLFGKFWG
ncbi:MAG: permease [Sedimentisphaerales bacterium]|nr:permease [Sedimentisphaerales bacterium]